MSQRGSGEESVSRRVGMWLSSQVGHSFLEHFVWVLPLFSSFLSPLCFCSVSNSSLRLPSYPQRLSLTLLMYLCRHFFV